MISKSKTRWAALSAVGLLALGSAGCAYDDYGDHRGGWGRYDRGADRDHRRDRHDRDGPRRDRDRDRDRDHRDRGDRDHRGDRDGRRGN